MTDKPIYTVMRRSGRIMQFRDGLAGDRTETAGGYLHILDVVATEMGSAGSTWDAPDKLFLNGNLVVEKGLANIAWDYRQDRIDAGEAVSRYLKNIHTPDWVPDEERKPGYNPGGVDRWTVKKEDR